MVSLDIVVCLFGPIEGPKVDHFQNVLTPVVTMATGSEHVWPEFWDVSGNYQLLTLLPRSFIDRSP